MKKSILLLLLTPFALKAGFGIVRPTWTNLLEVRPDPWPINLHKIIKGSDTSYALEFRDQQVLNGVVLDTLPFPNLEQLRYFEQGLSALKKGTNGDIATFKDYSVKRADVKKDGVWYILRFEAGLTNFQQQEANKMIATIVGL